MNKQKRKNLEDIFQREIEKQYLNKMNREIQNSRVGDTMKILRLQFNLYDKFLNK